MADCKYCGRAAGAFVSEHLECAEAAKRVNATMKDLSPNADQPYSPAVHLANSTFEPRVQEESDRVRRHARTLGQLAGILYVVGILGGMILGGLLVSAQEFGVILLAAVAGGACGLFVSGIIATWLTLQASLAIRTVSALDAAETNRR